MELVQYKNEEDAVTHSECIESVADILDIVNRPNIYLREIIDTDPSDPNFPAPLGRNHQGTPRPYPHGIWFRGQPNANFAAIPSVFRTIGEKGIHQFFDEREMFTDVRLRSSKADLRGLNNLELMCLMQHHALPTRLLDWSESPMVAAFFAASPQHYNSFASSGRVDPNTGDLISDEGKTDCALYALNAYRLNEITNLAEDEDSKIFHPQDIDVVVRSLMAEHTYINNVAERISHLGYVVRDKNGNDTIEKIRRLSSEISRIGTKDLVANEISEDVRELFSRMMMPVAVMPKRNHARMVAQLSCFTMHGGKIIYSDAISNKDEKEKKNWNFINPPINLFQLIQRRPKPFMKKFKIASGAIYRIMSELDRLGVSEALIYQDMENQSNFAKRRWATMGEDRKIMSWPRINRDFGS